MLTRGSITAAEKVVRESESLDMGSPDKREAIPPVDDVEDSPVFKYLCNLSPIKPAKPMHHAQTYNELTFPPEPRIFASPRTSRRTSCSSLKRVVAAEGWHQSNSRSTMTDNAPSPSPHVGTPCSRRQEGEEVVPQASKNENESFTVDELVGQGMFAMNPNPEQLQSQFTGFDQLEPVEKSSTDNKRQSTASSLSQDQSSSKCPEELKAGTVPELDHETTAMAYFLAGNETLEQDQTEWSEDSSDVVALSEEAEKQDSDLLETMASESGLDLSVHGGATLTENVNLQLSDKVDTAGQRGFRRRCLDFDASGARRRSLGSKKPTGSRLKECSGITVVINNDESPVLGNVIPDATASRLEDNSSNANGTSDSGSHPRGDIIKVQQQLPNESNVDVLNRKAAEVQTQKQAIISPEGVRRSPRVRRTGIGLHLNSLTTTMSFKRDTGGESTTKRVLATSLGLQQPPPPKETDHPVVLRISTPADVPAVPDFTSLNIDNLPPLEESLALTPIPNLPRLVSPRGQKRSLSHQQSGEEEATDDLLESPPSSKRRRLSRRKRPPPAQGEKPSDGCKRCNCKKSKCLKLYCECFAAGVYCVGSCACRHCFNKPEYEDTVRNTRLQIESRNPLAFAPKIVQGAEASPVPGDEALETPASARHKRGCNCKKSLCLKKYCECFQAGVGCSEGCRCEGCKNMFGKKEGPAEGEEKEAEQAISSREESQVEDPVELFSRMNGNPGRLRQDNCAKAHLSPITPSFEQDGHGRSMLRLRSTGRKRITSDEHCLATPSPLASAPPKVSSKPPKSPTSSLANTLDSFDLVPQQQGGDNSDNLSSINNGGSAAAAGETTPTFARITNHVSPRWGEGLTDLCSLTPMPLTTKTTLQPTPGSCVTSERPGGASPGFRTESPSSTRASPRAWSPHSPTFRQPAPRSPLRFNSPGTQITGKSLQKELESVKDDDDTLEFLNYTNNNAAQLEEMSSPSRICCTVTTKSSSPKQKRVTPPRQAEHFHHQQQQQQPFPSSPAGLRNSKRFILQALPPVPHPHFPNG